ncbi:MAG: CoB--CoM heterodisulfide reductase iron-sulfur subunit A family protein [Deltaproteobacteria bacterium]|nr:CoB--CoM heterodisulfide reductase iron-sulfur subunit A family protein [Deltaproteobacteria bacterium]
MEHKRALVVGGGIAGIQASLDLADAGVEVFLLERGPSIGGRMAQLDKTFPTNDCSMCILSPKLVEAGSHPNIKLLTKSELLGLEGEAPRFVAHVRKHPRYVDEDKCTGCGICTTKCPVKIPDPYNVNLDKTRCLHIPFPQAVPGIPVMDASQCIYFKRGKCRVCEKVCPADAIDFTQQPKDIDLEVGAVVLAIGSQEFEARLKDEYGYGTFDNVVTSIEFERMLSASGPTSGHIKRPSDGEEPARVAFLQCVGSRDLQVERAYCSAVCCMQATKHAVILTEHLSGVESCIFYMDIRSYGKGFDRFVDRARDEYGVRFIRSRVSSVEVDPETDDLVLQYAVDGCKLRKEKFNLLVLSVGLCSNPGIEALVRRLDLEPGNHGFLVPSSFRPVDTERVGVYACGTINGPKDIPESVMEASGASSAALCSLAGFPAREVSQRLPPEKDLRAAPPRVGVFVCRCGINIGSVVDVPSVVEYAASLPRVVLAEERLFACSSDSQKTIAEAIQEHDLTRVVVAACTPRTHEPLFQKTMAESGLNPYLFEFANIREHNSWVHQKEPARATEKAKDLVRMAVAKAVRLKPLTKSRLPVTKSALVIGGGVAGMAAALDLSTQRYPVTLVEKDEQLGGHARRLFRSLQGEDVKAFLAQTIRKIESDERISVHLGTEVERIDGYVGNFHTRLSDGSDVDHGVVVVATGGEEYRGKDYLYGQDARVLTQTELEERLGGDGEALQGLESVVMIQCVGSRDEQNPYCSRICCGTALKNALWLLDRDPDTRIFVLCRDVRAYGLMEPRYQEARERGVVFVRYEPDARPQVSNAGGSLQVRLKDEILGEKILLRPDLVVLSTGITARPGNKPLSQSLKVPLDADGFFLEAHVKLRPVDFATDGVFVCGLAHYPKDIGESISQARAAASRAATVLARDEIESEGKIARVDEALCSGCGACTEVCAYGAVKIDADSGLATVNAALCKGCGTCAATCRVGAVDLSGFSDAQLAAVLECF